MNPHDFIFNQIKNGCLSQGIIEEIAIEAAAAGLAEFKEGRYSKKPIDLIEEKIKHAKKVNKNASK